MDVAGTLTAITAAIGLAKELKEVDQQLDKADLKLKIAELTSALADAKIGLTDVAEQLRAKDDEISRLNSFDTNLSDKVAKSGFYFDTFEDGSPKGDPYCPHCIDKKSGLFRLRTTNKPRRPSECANCKTEYAHALHYRYEQQTTAS